MTLIIYVVPLESRLPELPLPAARRASPARRVRPALLQGPLHAGPHACDARAGSEDRPERLWARPDRGCPRRHLGAGGHGGRDPARPRAVGGHPDSDVLMAPRDSRWAPTPPRNHIGSVASGRTAPDRRPHRGRIQPAPLSSPHGAPCGEALLIAQDQRRVALLHFGRE